jgi:hypothetical protein
MRRSAAVRDKGSWTGMNREMFLGSAITLVAQWQLATRVSYTLHRHMYN